MEHLTDEQELVKKLQKGDIEAFDLIYKKYSGKIYAFAFRYLKSSEESEELVQSVFLKLWEDRNDLKSELSFKSFIFTITYNDICKSFRKRIYHQKFVKDYFSTNIELTQESENVIDYNSAMERVQLIINRLPQKQKAIFVKSRIDGKTSKEIAAEMNISTDTVYNYISESLRFIMKCLKDEDILVVLVVSLFYL